MTNKSILYLLSITVLSGCVSSNQLQSQFAHLNSRVTQLEKALATNKAEIAAVRRQRVVRLPTGAPTQTQARSSVDEQAFQAALNQYKSGDVQGAITAFEQFTANYPNTSHRTQALFYLGQAAYTTRDYTRAQQALEKLVFQPNNGHVEQSAANLLRKVYQAQGNTADQTRLTRYLQSLSTSSKNATDTTASSVIQERTNILRPTTLYQ